MTEGLSIDMSYSDSCDNRARIDSALGYLTLEEAEKRMAG